MLCTIFYEIRHCLVCFQNSKILNTIANAIDNKEELKKRIENGKILLQELLTCVQNCQSRFGGKSELATEDDIRYALLWLESCSSLSAFIHLTEIYCNDCDQQCIVNVHCNKVEVWIIIKVGQI